MTKECVNSYAMKVSQASRTGLVVLTYEIAKAYINDSLEQFNKGLMSDFRSSLNRARSFINQLASSVDLQYEMGINLMKLYIFMNKALNRAAIREDISELPRITKMLDKLKNAFTEVGKSDTSEPVMQNTEQVYSGLTYSKNSLNDNMYVNNAHRGYTV